MRRESHKIVCSTMDVGRNFSRGGAVGDFPKIFPEGPKVVKFVFYPSKLKKQPFLLIILKSRGALDPLPPFRRPCVQLHIYATNCMAKCIHPNTVVRSKN